MLPRHHSRSTPPYLHVSTPASRLRAPSSILDIAAPTARLQISIPPSLTVATHDVPPELSTSISPRSHRASRATRLHPPTSLRLQRISRAPYPHVPPLQHASGAPYL